MTSFYGKYKLDPNKNIEANKDTDVLKKDFTLNYTDFEKLKIAEQYNKLYSAAYNINEENIKIDQEKKVFNLSINQLIQRSGVVYMALINDLSIYFSNGQKEKDLNRLGYIMTKDENLLYIGMFILILAFFLWLIQVTS
jgi:hypothetical protein